jgi:hypothetical protein
MASLIKQVQCASAAQFTTALSKARHPESTRQDSDLEIFSTPIYSWAPRDTGGDESYCFPRMTDVGWVNVMGRQSADQ